MCPFLDNLDDFDIFDSARARRLYEKQRRKAACLGSGSSSGPRHKRPDEDYDHHMDYDEYDDYEEYEEYEEYDDCDEDEFDSYARIHHPY